MLDILIIFKILILGIFREFFKFGLFENGFMLKLKVFFLFLIFIAVLNLIFCFKVFLRIFVLIGIILINGLSFLLLLGLLMEIIEIGIRLLKLLNNFVILLRMGILFNWFIR